MKFSTISILGLLLATAFQFYPFQLSFAVQEDDRGSGRIGQVIFNNGIQVG